MSSRHDSRARIVTDSTCDLDPALAERLGVRVVPLRLCFGGSEFRDGVDLDVSAFYRRLENVEEDRHPTTRPPTLDDLIAAHEAAAAQGSVVSIHLSSALSETMLYAETSARSLRHLAISVVDSSTVSVGLGLEVVLAALLAERGASRVEIVRRLEGLRSRIRLVFAVPSLDYLARGGRIGRAAEWIGRRLGIRPVLGVEGGEVVPLARVRAGKPLAPVIAEHLLEGIDPDQPLLVGYAGSGSASRTGKRIRSLREALAGERIVREIQSPIGPVVGVHTGPGCHGAALVPLEPDEVELVRSLPAPD